MSGLPFLQIGSPFCLCRDVARELEVLERVATSGKLNLVLGEKGLAERVVNLL